MTPSPGAPALSSPLPVTDESRRRGACPTLDAPMQTGDGLLARIRVRGGILTPSQLRRVAELAAIHGNGLVEVTARGNLQVRGLTAWSAPTLADAVLADVDVETGLVVDTSPLAGCDPHETGPSRSVAAAISEGAAGFANRLGPKVCVVVDGAGQISLSALKADIRLLAVGSNVWSVTLGGGKPQLLEQDAALAATLAVLGALAAMGPQARAVDLFPAAGVVASRRSLTAVALGMPMNRTEGTTQAIALPFGSVVSERLAALASAAEGAGVSAFRLGPDHTLLIDDATPAVIDAAERLGFVTTADDPRLRISACIGSSGCASGHIAARDIAARLASELPADTTLHVSGCAKGCAHPRPADVTLVGLVQGIGLVIDGRAGDTPRYMLDESRLGDVFVRSQDAR
nr:precorrin-3B synthase [Devosia lucknowensis]